MKIVKLQIKILMQFVNNVNTIVIMIVIIVNKVSVYLVKKDIYCWIIIVILLISECKTIP